MIKYLELTRPLNCLMAGLAILIGSIVGAGGAVSPYMSQMALAFIAGCVITAGGNAINDFYDAKIDATNKPFRPIPSGRVSAKGALRFSIGLLTVGVALSYFINFICFLIAMANSLILIYYAYRLKRTVLWGNICIGYLTGSAFLFGGAAVNGIAVTSTLFMLAMLTTIGREIVKDMEDLEGDKKEGAVTLPIRIGKRKSTMVALMFIILAVLLSPIPVIFGILGTSYLLVVALACVILLVGGAVIKKSPSMASLLIKSAMVVALFAFIVGAMLVK
ncbi:MAG: geranylgeranylglycerol-phosphate geranylgeranyltransferase [Methanosarcinales archaeon Met12]|nr:MAG: geranylgeranylglycerol-phosphate geranylgeranyltransferase [Methanosarcinales archaeon Met12]